MKTFEYTIKDELGIHARTGRSTGKGSEEFYI